MITVGPNSPGTMADDATVGTVSWTNPDNAKINDNIRASVTILSTETSHYLKATNFGFSVPVDATISGILVEIKCRVNGSSMNAWTDVRIVKGGSISETSKTGGSSINTSDSTYYSIPSTGGESDLWEDTWTSDDINDSTFGVVMSMTNSSVSNVLSVDHIRITVYYINPFHPLPSFYQ